MPHNVFEQQPDLSSRGTLVYYLRLILHDWPDKYCIRILQNLVLSLKDEGIALINENVLSPIGVVNSVVEKLGK